MKMDKSKMSAEELAQLDEFEKKYGIPDETPPEGTGVTQAESAASETTNDMTKSNGPDGLHPEVAKALAEVTEMKKKAAADIEEMKKSLEMERLTTFAKKYEMLGKKPDELAAKLYEMKKAGGTAYDDYVSLLDEQVSMFEKSGVFSEIGKNTIGCGNTQTQIEKAATELRKADPTLSREKAFVKACEQNPELLAEYEQEYNERRLS